jgi:DUF4097 and DUF4098 domain-containing protein YvlB
MRPRSITGPLILVAIGVLFLLRNIRPALSVFTLLETYWPFILIGAGVIGLIEVLFHASRGSSPPPRPISGGAIFWILILCIFVGFIDRHRNWDFRLNDGEITLFGSDYGYDVSPADFRGVSARGATELLIENLRGNLSIIGSDGDAVTVKGRKTIRAFDRSMADRRNEQTGLHLDRQGDVLVLRGDTPSTPVNFGFISTDLEITVPRGMRIETRGRSGDLTVMDIDGSLDITAGRGDVHLDRIGNNVRVESSRGGDVHAANLKGNLELSGRGSDVQLDNIAGQVTINGQFSGTLTFRALAKSLHFESQRTDFRVEAVPGEVVLDLGELRMSNVSGPVHFEGGSRDVQATDVSNALDLTIENGDIQITATKSPLAKIDAHSRHGDITLTVPENTAFQLNASTAQGEVENSFGEALRSSSEGRRATITGQTGSGPLVSLTTNRGTVSVRKG